jgi:hypothetical protein
MLISLREKFIFIATQKTASTAIETALAPRADIRLTESEFGKHMTVEEMLRNLHFLFNETGPEKFFIFGVMREPVDFALSLFNSHLHPGFAGRARLSTAGMGFGDFLARWVPANRPQIAPQHTRFLDKEGRLGANYIISYGRLADGLREVSRHLRGPRFARLRRQNASPAGLRRDQLSAAELAWIEDHFRDDFRFMARYCDRRLQSFSERPVFG